MRRQNKGDDVEGGTADDGRNSLVMDEGLLIADDSFLGEQQRGGREEERIHRGRAYIPGQAVLGVTTWRRATTLQSAAIWQSATIWQCIFTQQSAAIMRSATGRGAVQYKYCCWTHCIKLFRKACVK